MAEAMEQQDKIAGERLLVTFHLGREEFGTDIMNVREIVRLGEITKVPQSPFYMEGVSNLRGSILPIIDGRKRFGMENRANDESTRVLVVDIRGTVTGVIVDRVAEVLRVNEGDIEPPPAVLRQGLEETFINGVVKLQQGRRIIMALNMEAVLAVAQSADNELAAVSSAVGEQVNTSRETVSVAEEQLVTFTVATEEYAFDIMRVKEIIRVPDITRVPNAIHFFEGVVSIRNQLLPIVNLRLFFGLPDLAVNDQSRIIIVDTGKVTVGFRVDRVAEVIRVPLNLIEAPPQVYADDAVNRIRGVAKLNQGKRLLMCLYAEHLLPDNACEKLLGDSAGSQERVVEEKSSQNRQVIDEEQLVTFLLGKEEFAVQIKHVQEINRMTEITRMPGAPAFVEGLVNLRGNIIPAINLRTRFGQPDREKDDRTRIIIIDLNERKTGIVVDSVSEVLRLERSMIEAAPEMVTSGVDGEFVSGVGTLNEGKRMVIILDLSTVVNFRSGGAGLSIA